MTLTADADDFDAALWRSYRNSTAESSPRAGMLTDLEVNHLRVGMAQAEAEALLGPPDFIDGRKAVYNLGASPYGVDYEAYVLDYDQASRLAGFYLRRY